MEIHLTLRGEKKTSAIGFTKETMSDSEGRAFDALTTRARPHQTLLTCRFRTYAKIVSCNHFCFHVGKIDSNFRQLSFGKPEGTSIFLDLLQVSVM